MPRVTPKLNLSDQVADQLRRRLAAGEFPVGARIPTETELMTEMGVSRNSLREAVRSLVHAGLLRAQAGSGTYVVATSDLAPTLARRVPFDRPNDTAEVRLLLEREATRLAASRATADEVEKLRTLLAQRDAATQAQQHATADAAFHHQLVALAGNELLAELYRGIGGVEEAHRRSGTFDPDFDRFHPGLREIDAAHGAIVDAVAAGDPDAAAAAVEHNVRLVEAQVDSRLNP
ncbi:FadR/GntR family transcriptional regulator [Kineosporia mesophila]|nr:FCD domain-containing protein [Kineosporia mesophila]MCD5350528.1 FCD domain-containing protein [Kineosporia mesophila]